MAFIASGSLMGHEVTELLRIQWVSDCVLWQENTGAKQDVPEYIV